MAVWPSGLRAKPRISSPYGRSAGYTGFHYGVDMYGFPFNCAIADGQVIHIGWNTFGGGGREIWYRIGNGDVIVYYHNDVDVFVVDKEWITEGKPLGVQSNTGQARGAHLHAEVWRNGRRDSRTDPVAYIAALVGTSPAGGDATPFPEQEEEETMYIVEDVKEGKGKFLVTSQGVGGATAALASAVNRTTRQPENAAVPLFYSEIAALDASIRAIARANNTAAAAIDVKALAATIAPLLTATGAPTAEEIAKAVNDEEDRRTRDRLN